MAAKVGWNNRGYWELRDRHPSHEGGRKVLKLGPTEEDRQRGLEAALQLNAERAAHVTRKESLRKGAPIYGRDALPLWWEAAKGGYGPGNRKNMASMLRNHVLPYFGRLDLRTLTRADIKDFGGKMACKPRARTEGTLGLSMVENCTALLSCALHWLAEQRHLEYELPVPRMRDLASKAAAANGARKGDSVDAYSRAEAEAVLAALAVRHRALHDFVFVALHTGARYGELVALEWGDVDLARGLLRIDKNMERLSGVKGTKTTKPRTFQMGSALIAHLRQRAAERMRAPAPHARLLTNSDGRPWAYFSPNSAWQRFRKAARRDGMRTLHFHCWRHTYVSWGLHANIDRHFLAKQIGDDLDTMMSHYAKFVAADVRVVDFMRAAEPAALQPQGSPAGDPAAG